MARQRTELAELIGAPRACERPPRSASWKPAPATVAVEPFTVSLGSRMASKTTRKTSKKSTKAVAATPTASQFTVVLEDVRAQFTVFGEALQGLREHMDRRFESVERQLGLLTDAVRTHSKELQRIETKLDGHEKRISKLEGAAE
jgi:hypothetical protein